MSPKIVIEILINVHYSRRQISRETSSTIDRRSHSIDYLFESVPSE